MKKCLGVYLDANFKWPSHIDCFLKKGCSAICVIRFVCSYLNIRSIRFDFAEIQSVFQYSIVLVPSNASKIYNYQKRILRAIYRLKQMTSCRNYFMNFNKMTVISLYIYNIAIYASKKKVQK